MTHRSRHRAFTLIELVLVMLILCIAMAVTAPSLSGWSHGSKLRDAADQFLSVTRWARGQAAATGQLHRLTIDPQSGTYQVTVQEGQQFVAIPAEFGRAFMIPEEFHIALLDGQSQQPMQFVDFYPSGRTQPAHVRISASATDVSDIECPTPAEGFRITTPQEGAR